MITVFRIDRAALNLDRHVADTRERVDRFVQGVVQTVFNEVQTGGRYGPGTPVGNPSLWKHRAPPGYSGGFARANWDRSQETQARAGVAVQMTNNAPYIRRLEYGWSRQAPNGFVRIVLANAQALVDEVRAHVFPARAA